MIKFITLILNLFLLAPANAESFELGLSAYDQRDYQSAFAIWVSLADRGHRPSQYALALSHLNGYNNFPEDSDISAKYYALLASSSQIDNFLWNKPRQQVFLGNIYQTGNQIRENEKEAIRWYQKASSRNYAPAQYHLAQSYEKGRGVEQNYDRAFNLFSRSAFQGHGKAQEALGRMYLKGQGVEKNILYAAVWFNISGIDGENSELSTVAKSCLFSNQEKKVRALTIACIFGINVKYHSACWPEDRQKAHTFNF